MSKNILKVFKTLSDPTRIKMVKGLIDKKEIACHDLMKHFSLSQPTLSHHFGKLIDSGIFQVRKEGVNHYYSMNKKYLAGLGIDIKKIAK